MEFSAHKQAAYSACNSNNASACVLLFLLGAEVCFRLRKTRHVNYLAQIREYRQAWRACRDTLMLLNVRDGGEGRGAGAHAYAKRNGARLARRNRAHTTPLQERKKYAITTK